MLAKSASHLVLFPGGEIICFPTLRTWARLKVCLGIACSWYDGHEPRLPKDSGLLVDLFIHDFGAKLLN